VFLVKSVSVRRKDCFALGHSRSLPFY
jgi:hypothetical protein